MTPEVEAVMKEKGWTQGHSMTRALLNHQKVKKWTKVGAAGGDAGHSCACRAGR